MTTPITQCREWQRINALPIRRDHDELLASRLTVLLRTHGGTQTLRPAQAGSLVDLAQAGDLFCALPVGAGKTLVSLLASRMVPC